MDEAALLRDIDLWRVVKAVLGEHGWVATTAQLSPVASWRDLDSLTRSGRLVRVSRGRYAARTGLDARVAAHRAGGVAAYATAAQHHRFAVKTLPARPSVTLPRGRKASVSLRSELDVTWRDLPADDVADFVTTPLRTVLDCAARLPFDEALCIADSALASGSVDAAALRARLAGWPCRGRARVSRVVEHADPRSASALESLLRAVCLSVPGLLLTPQWRIEWDGTFVGTVDLADPRLRIAIEAEGFQWHADRPAFERDCYRYDELVAAGWVVLRFTWRQVVHQPAWVRSVLAAAVATRGERRPLPR